MVGLEAAVAYTDELERQLGRVEQMNPADIEPTCALIDRACRKLAIFLDELVAGAPPVPLKLFPEYEAMQRLRGVKAAAATDLFFPKCSLRTPLPGVPLPVSPKKLAPHLLKQRRVYQNGLLGFLRGDAEGAQEDARSRGRAGAGERSGVRARVLVDRRRVLRSHRRGRPRSRLRREAARRAARPADSPRRRGLGQGRDPVAARGALLRCRERPGDAHGPGGAESLRSPGAHPVRGGAQRGHDQAPADPARSARTARHGEEHLAAGHAGPGGQPAEVARDAAARARECASPSATRRSPS